MQLKSALVSSPRQKDFGSTGSRLRKKHKRLDAICENIYNQNHSESNDGKGEQGSLSAAAANSELRRSSRVRRAPDLLDASPPPAKRRRKINKNINLSVNKNNRSSLGSTKKEESDTLGDLDTPGSWRSRLRSRVGNVRTGKRRVMSGKRKLFDDIETGKSELAELKGEVDGGKLLLVNSKTSGRVKAVYSLKNGEEEGPTNVCDDLSDKDEGEMCIEKDESEMSIEEDENENDEIDVEGNEEEESIPVSDSQMSGRNEVEIADGDGTQLGLDEEEEEERLDSLELEKRVDKNHKAEKMEQSDNEVEELESESKAENETGAVGVHWDLMNKVGDGGHCNKEEVGLVDVNEMPLEGESDPKLDKLKHDSADTLGRPRIKQGRRCGLCGCGIDGKPPKRLVQDAGESENEAYSGSSASEEPNYDIWDGFGDEPGWLGRLLGPINDRYGIAGVWVHQNCAVWSPEVYFAGLGCLKNVRAALCRGRALKCTRCGRPGATIGCRVDRCPKTYHLPCARANGCIFDHRRFLIACTDHRHLFQPYGNQYLMQIKKLKARKMKLELRKLSNDEWRKDVEAEEKWLENCGEDEEFLKRESKRLHRDLLRIAPVYIGGSEGEGEKRFEGWETVAGLQDVIRCMKEVVILPLLYPEFFNNLGITPPRGVLLHGYPGTGKTLVVRALIGSCAHGDKRIAYFARKGADCLGKYVGDAERQLRLLFQVAERCQPSIIFFDEIDGLAPCRTRQQDQTHSSVVSTLLALMDGLKSRGSVVVIGATNRPEAVDPALRRPGRFDREIYFPLPSVEDRAAILSLHTRKWPKPVTGSLLKWIARRTVGFAGADLQALCTQAAIIALKRNCPLQEILSAAEAKAPGAKCPPLTAFAVKDRDWLEALACSPPPCSRREAGVAAYDIVSCPLPTHLIPCLLQPLSTLVVLLSLDEQLWLPPPLLKAATIIKILVVSYLEKNNLPSGRWWSYVDDFLKEPDVVKELKRGLSCAGMLIGEANEYTDETSDESGYSMVHNDSMNMCLFRGLSFAPRKKLGFRVLIAGSPRSGQRYLASCILHCFIGNIEIKKIDLATVSHEGHGDMVQGLTQLLMKCASLQSCMIFMPRIDLWAVEAQVNEESVAPLIDQQLTEKKECGSQVFVKDYESSAHQGEVAGMVDAQNATRTASHVWNSFVEQVESICVSTSLMILATSEVPFQELPHRIRQFFKIDISNGGMSNVSEHMGPWFSVHVDRNFNLEEVISLSAAELARDMILAFLHLIHQRAHTSTGSSKENKIDDSIQNGLNTECETKSHGSVGGNEGRIQCPYDSSLKFPSPLNKSSKGKSSVLSAISTFGFQILRCPHFAELCWVTSKLKEGPCTDVSGPWKGWPFNSCIIRPNDSVEKLAVACSSGGFKSKDRSGLVRGLIAVGLLAYRGFYKSLKEVSFEVRKVLELLVGQVNEKIQAGKDRYQYVRILSQVAYLEDMVNSWVHALQSLEFDPQTKVANAKLSTMEFPVNHTCADNPVQSVEDKGNVSYGSSHEGFASDNIEGTELNKRDDFELRATLSEDELAQEVVHFGHSGLDKHVQISSADKQFAGDDKIEEDRTVLQQCMLGNNEPLGITITLDSLNVSNIAQENTEPAVIDQHSESLKESNIFHENTDNAVIDQPSESLKESSIVQENIEASLIGGNSDSLKQFNGYKEFVTSSENGICTSGDLAASKISVSEKFSSKVNGLAETDRKVGSDDSEHSENLRAKISPGKTVNPVNSQGEFLYSCCTECFYVLHDLIQKILHEWELNKSHWTTEDVHDVVASLSVDLLSAVRKLGNAENIRNSFDGKLDLGNSQIFSKFAVVHKCCCRSLRSSPLVSMECSCHSTEGCVNERANDTLNFLVGIDLKFVFRDGILVPLDSSKDVSFPCKYETLCLCSLIEIVMMKQPFH